MGLARKLLGSPTGGDSGETVTLGDGDDVNHLVHLEDGVNVDLLLEEVLSEVDLVGNRASVDLDFHEVGLLLLKRSLADLGVSKNTDDRAVLLDALELLVDWRRVALCVLLGVFGESLLLALVPVLVEAAPDLLTKVLSPDSGEGSESTGSLDISDDTNANHLENPMLSIPSLHNRILGKVLTGGVSMTVTASTTSFLCILAPGLSKSRTIVVIPALYPRAAVRWTDFLGSSLGKDLTFPLCLAARFLGRKAREPWRGASCEDSQFPIILIRRNEISYVFPTN